MLLRHVGENDAAARLDAAIADVTREGKTLTYDLAGDGEPASTSAVAQAVVERLR
jgi:isocitrate dehydrogenase (NAD+)